ncbi:MFS transporter [uncultured Roseibium sp.]|uniref:MFS transporter n=1 Tax=uncultured Roseibium sp. TaxID=1936171 RepID=UPI0026244825|nr:MFS transporter [uncultured Roseibium sp.]
MSLASTNARRSNRWLAVYALYLAMFMNILDMTVVNLALPVIRAEFNATDTQLEWIVVVYILTFAAGLLPFGRFGDVVGRDKVFLCGVAGFTGSSLACGVAPDTQFLIISRAVQGLCAAAMVPQILAIVHVIFNDTEKGKAIGLFGSISALGAVAGPLVGGLIVTLDVFDLSWRPIFLMNLPIGLISIFGALRFLPSLQTGTRLAPDWSGTVLFLLAVTLVLFPLVEGRQFGWPFWCFGLMALGLAGSVLFYRQQVSNFERGLPELLPVSLCRDRSFVLGVAYVSICFSALAGLFFVLSIYLQSGLGLTPLSAGLTLAPHPLGVMLASTLTGRLGTRVQELRILTGASFVLAGVTVLWLIANSGLAASNGFWLGLPLFAVGLGTGFLIPALFQRVLSRVSGADAGAGSGVLQAFQQLGMAVGIALQGQIFFQTLEKLPGGYSSAAGLTLLYPITLFGVLVALSLFFFLGRQRGPKS